MITYSAFIYFLSKLPFFQIVQVKGIDDILGLHGVYAGYKNFNQTKLNKAIAKFIMLLLVLGIMIIPMIMGFSI